MFFKKTAARVAQEVRLRLGPGRVALMDERANFFGIQSKGVRQMRGNGCLALSPDEILFVMWWPRREVLIARSHVTSIERAKSHLGKTIGRELLKVHYVNDTGAADSVAWYLSDLSSWESALAAEN